MNEIVYVFDYDKESIAGLMQKYEVTSISATPTFYRTALAMSKETFGTVRHVTLGGEKYDNVLVGRLKQVFPNARIRNIYALTEAGSLFRADGEIFEIYKDYTEYIKFSEANELLINKKLLADMDDYRSQGDWYHTGDIVELVGDGKFRFVSRSNEMINIGGYKVNPNEVEEEIMKIDGVADVIVSARRNSVTGNILVAEVVKSVNVPEELLEKEIFATLSKAFPKWKIPGRVLFKTELAKTRTGKKDRK